MLRYLPYILLLLALTCVPALALDGELSGEALLRYGAFTAEERGAEVVDARSFSQQYSLLYSLDGRIKEGRGGTYRLALGYEWNAIDADVVNQSRGIDSDFEVQTGKILYRGELKFEPGGLPLRFHAYSRDMRRSTLVEDTKLPPGSDLGTIRTESILSPNIIDDIQNGQHIQTGATLLVGIRNGSYLGRYRDILSQFPRLLVDYREIDVRDLESTTPQDYRSRDLAFVSLNKKDNWFHYRYHDFTDRLDHRNDSSEKQIMLGTVDHNLMRQWINLTNWIQVSTDGALTESKYQYDPRRNEDRFDLNLFARARRMAWESSTYATYQRSRQVDLLEKDLEVPVFASGELNRDTSWRAQLIHYSQEDISEERALAWNEDDLFGKVRFETFRRAPVILAPTLEAEVKTGNRSEGRALRLGAEAFSNQAYDPRLSWLGGLQLALFDGNGVNGEEVEYWETIGTGKLRYLVTDRLQAGVKEQVIYGNGDLVRGMTEQIAPYGERNLLESNNEFEERTGTTVRSTTTLFVDHDSNRRLRNRLEFIYDVLSADGNKTSQVIGRHRLNWDNRTWRVDATTEYVTGDDVETRNVSSTLLTGESAGATGSARLTHSSRVDYHPNRLFETSGRLEYDLRSVDGGSDNERLYAAQEARYNIMTVNGVVRRIAELTEELSYERLEGEEDTSSVFTLGVGGNYYPTHALWLGAAVRYRYFKPQAQDEMAYYLMAGLNFAKLQISLDYAYGDRTSGDDGTPDRIEHRWHVTMRKTF